MNKKLLFGIVIMFFLVPFTMADLTTNNELYYSFDDDDLSGSNPLDLTPNGNDGTNTGATTGATGLINQAFDFGGNDDVDTNYQGLTDGDTFSFSFWIYGNAEQTATNILADYDRGGTIKGVAIGLSSADQIQFQNRLSGGGGNGDNYIGTTTILDNTWYHVAGNVNGDGSFNLWVNGVAEGSRTSTNLASSYYSGLDWRVATLPSSPNNKWDGLIDELSIWKNDALDQTDVDTLYNSGAGLQYPYTVASSYFTINARDVWDNSVIDSFNASIQNRTCITTNSSIVYDGLQDCSGNNNTLTNNGAVFVPSLNNGTVNLGTAAKFDGDSAYTEFSDQIIFNPETQTLTLMGWFKIEETCTGQNQNECTLLGDRAEIGITLVDNSNFKLWVGGIASVIGYGSSILDNYIHIAGVWDYVNSSNRKIYVNGNLLGTDSNSVSNTNYTIDNVVSEINQYLNGNADEVKVFFSALTKEEIENEMLSNILNADIYYSFDVLNETGETAALKDYSGNQNTLTNNGATYNATLEAFQGDGGTLNLQYNGSNLSKTYEFWSTINVLQSRDTGIVAQSTNAFDGYISFWDDATTSFRVEFSDGSSGNVQHGLTGSELTNNINHFLFTNEGDAWYLYVNGNKINNAVQDGSKFIKGNYLLQGYASNSFDGTLYMFREYLTDQSSNASELYSRGVNGAPVDFDSLVAWYNFQNGTVDVNVSAENYFSRVYQKYAVNQTLNAQLFSEPLSDFTLLTPNDSLTNQSSYNVTWTESVSPTGKDVTYTVNVSYTSNGSIVSSNTTSNLYFDLDLTNFNANNYTVEVTATEAFSDNVVVKSSTLIVDKPNYLYFFNEQTSNPISGANITIDFPNADSQTLVTNTNGFIQFNSYQNDTLQTGNYSITFQDFIGFVTPITFTETFNTLPVNQSYNITVTNINVSIFYRTNFTAFTNNATVIIEGLDNYTTDTGNIFLQNASLSSGTYRITVSSDGYFNEEKTFTFSGQDDLDLNIYMLELNNSNSGTVTIRTVDELSRLLAGSQVNLLEYDTSTLSYIEVSECFTDSNGECKFLVETNTKSYKFTAEKQVNGNTVTATTDPQIFEDDISGGSIVLFSEETITLTLSSQEQYSLNPVQNIIYSIDESFNNVTNQSNIAVSFRSIDGTNLEVCVEYFELNGGVKTSLTGDTFCVIGSSAEVTENAFFTLNRSKEYVADVYIKTNNGEVLLNNYLYKSNASFQEILINNATLPFFVLFIWIFIIGGSLLLKNVPLTGVVIIVGAWVIGFIFPTITIVSASVLQTILGISLIYVGRKKEDFN